MTDEQIWEAIERETGTKRPAVVTVEEFGDIFRLSRPTAYREVSRGSVRSIRTAGTIRIPVSEVFRRFREAEALPEVPKAKAQ